MSLDPAVHTSGGLWGASHWKECWLPRAWRRWVIPWWDGKILYQVWFLWFFFGCTKSTWKMQKILSGRQLPFKNGNHTQQCSQGENSLSLPEKVVNFWQEKGLNVSIWKRCESQELQISWLANISHGVSHSPLCWATATHPEGSWSSCTGRCSPDFQVVLFQKFSSLGHSVFLFFISSFDLLLYFLWTLDTFQDVFVKKKKKTTRK